MMNEQEVINVLTIRMLDGVGDVNGRRLIDFFGSAQEVLRQKTDSLLKTPGTGRSLNKKLDFGKARSAAESEMEFVLKNRIDVCPYG